MARDIITAQEARRLLQYDPETGSVVWIVNVGPNGRVGAEAGWLQQGRRRICCNGRQYGAHRIAWLLMTGEWPVKFIDHINGDPSDNRWVNLRDVSHQVNNQNQRAPGRRNTSGVLGVTWSRRHSKWFTQIRINGRRSSIGLFATKEEAGAAYIAAKRRLHPGCTI